MNSWIKYGLLNSLVGLVIGIYLALTATGDGYFVMGIAAPIAAFLTGGLIWKLLVKDRYDGFKILLAGLLTGTVSHYLSFILISIGMNICYWTTGECTDSLGGPPASILSMLIGAFGLSFFSLLFFGWITATVSIFIGMMVKRLDGKKPCTTSVK